MKYDYEDWNDEHFRKTEEVRLLAINNWMMISYERGVEKIKQTSSKTWINSVYYRDDILARYVLNDERLKIGLQYGALFFLPFFFGTNI